MNVREFVEAARGDRPLSLLIKEVDLVNVFTGEIYETSIGVYKDRIVNIDPEVSSFKAIETIDGGKRVAIPGLIDTHLHIESSMVTPARFAEAVLPHGTTTVFADPHEIANVLGSEGVRMMLENSRGLPLKIYYLMPTCVPESQAVTAGAEITPEDVEKALDWEGVVGLGEVMDFEGVVSGSDKMVRVLEVGLKKGVVIDGHCVLLSGSKLNAYVTAGPEADHENFTVESAIEKLRLGMYVKLRGPYILDTKRFVESLKRLPKPWNIIFVTDDVMPDNLVKKGHLDFVCRSFIEAGMDPVEVVRSVTLRPAIHMRTPHLGAISPGRIADILLLKSLERFEIDLVIANGRVVAKNGRLVANIPDRRFSPASYNTVRLPRLSLDDFVIKPPVDNGKVKVNVIDFSVRPGGLSDPAASFLEMILTRLSQAEIDVRNGELVLGEIALALVFERHGKGGGRGFGFVRNLIKSGALASTVAHDAHNLVVVGTNVNDMLKAANTVIEKGGGVAAVRNSRILALIELPIAGLMSEEPIEVMASKMEGLRRAFKEMGVLDHPYMPLPSLLTLSVIPHARITDKGVFDVDKQRFVDPFVGQ